MKFVSTVPRKVLGPGLAIAGLLTLAVAPAMASIAGSAHDFSGQAWSGGRTCVACHTPHGASSVSGAPLWNHATTASTFSTYSSATLDATVGQPGTISTLCLSCHDGTVAIDSFGGNTGSTTIAATANVGVDLSNDHPVGFVYDDALATADGGLVAVGGDNLAGTSNLLPLFAGKLECATCHDVHNGATAATVNNSLLYVDTAASALCLECHSK